MVFYMFSHAATRLEQTALDAVSNSLLERLAFLGTYLKGEGLIVKIVAAGVFVGVFAKVEVAWVYSQP